MNIVIVESAAKAKTINKYLGADYKVIASYGHVRDLPAKDGSVLPDNDFEMTWEVEADSSRIVNEIAKAVKGADRLILATDPDREGEAISWHLLKILEQKRALNGVSVERVAFNAVTKDAILTAMKNPRKIDEPLVDAYLARRALDYLVGFTLSPVLWRKLPGARSAGRVQSVALRLVVDREAEIEAFRTREYWTVEAALKNGGGDAFTARLVARDGKKLDKFEIPDETTAHAYRDAITGQSYRVDSVEAKDHKRNPAPPFTTSSLQQEASRKLGLSPRQTMQIAQKLYEGIDIGGETVGLITYMRTDGVQIVPEAIAQARGQIESQFGPRYVPNAPRIYKTKAKNAQEAHEAIRPTDFRRQPDKLRGLSAEEARLYKLIWQRAVASQMASADIERTTAEISVPGKDGVPYGVRATGSVVKFDGFMRLYEEGRDDTDDEDSARLPALKQGEALKDSGVTAAQHFTEPPPRYTEATLIREMERLGIGRPSTYASTMAVLREREYVKLDKKRLVPEDKGRLVTTFLEAFFKRYVEYDFTAYLEDRLDQISDGKLDWKALLREFWQDFIGAVTDIKDLRVAQVLDALNELLGPHIFPAKEDGGDPRLCPLCNQGQLSLKVGRFGAFVGCSNYPECRYTRQLKTGENGNGDGAAPAGDTVLGNDPETGLAICLKNGRFGPYIQLGEGGDGEKPKRASIPSGLKGAEVNLELALKLLALPRAVGLHPETQKQISAGFGRYGPYVEHDGKYVKIDAEEVFTIGLNRAVTVIAEGGSGGKGRAPKTEPIKVLGEHPEKGGKMEVLAGRFGPYIKWGKVNATIPKGTEPQDVTVEEAVRLIAARIEAGDTKKGRGKTAKSAKAKDAPAKEKKSVKAKAADAGDEAEAPKKAKAAAVKKTAANGKVKSAAKEKAAKTTEADTKPKAKAAAKKTTPRAAGGTT
ncbi:type I DNA topoisomerase [Rhodomicrobium sp.]|uniref:type I DNA topoisomerase n=1 Tax=Rhodomicrobium sp. TaxID=2720632 RepID=UPI0039E21907